MPKKTWTLTDVERGTYLPELAAAARDLGIDEPISIKKRTLRGGRQEGVDLVELDNGRIRIAVLPTRGMGVWKVWQDDKSLGWQSPTRGPVHPTFVPLMEPGGLGWLDGFDELLVRCGLESNGSPEFDADGRLKYPLHGKIANTPAHHVEVTLDTDARTLSIMGVVHECRFHFQKLRLTSTITTRFGESGFAVCDEITNIGATPATAQMLYHINFGPPLLEPGAKLIAPVKTIVPRTPHAASLLESWAEYPAPQTGAEESVYFFDLLGDAKDQTRVLLKNRAGDQGVSLWFNKQQLPYFIQWKNTPDYIDGYVTGLEPSTNFPNPRSFETEQGRVIQLEPGQTRQLDLHIDWHTDANSVSAIERAVLELQAQAVPQLLTEPPAGWCA